MKLPATHAKTPRPAPPKPRATLPTDAIATELPAFQALVSPQPPREASVKPVATAPITPRTISAPTASSELTVPLAKRTTPLVIEVPGKLRVTLDPATLAHAKLEPLVEHLALARLVHRLEAIGWTAEVRPSRSGSGDEGDPRGDRHPSQPRQPHERQRRR